MENRREGLPAAEIKKERLATPKTRHQLAVCTLIPTITGTIFDVANHRETSKVADMTEAVKHVGLSYMVVTENVGLIPQSMQLVDFEERLLEIYRELAVGEKLL